MSSKPLTLPNREIIRIRDGLDSLANGIVNKAGSTTEIHRFDDLDDKVAWNVAKNFDIFDRAVETYQKRRKAIGAKYGVVERMALTPQNAPQVAKYQSAEEELLDATQELNGVLRLKLSEVQNAGSVPAGVLRNLMPILDQ